MAGSSSEIHGRALVVDPDEVRSASRSGQLTSVGWQTLRAASTDEALAAIRRDGPDVVVLHVCSHEADATDLPALMRSAEEVPYLPLIILADEPTESVRCRFLDSGADDVVGDDISCDELDARLRAMVRVKALQDELRRSKEALSDALDRERALLRQLRHDNAHLLTLSTTDPLTHLQNVRCFDAFLDSEFRITRRYNRRLSLLTFDLDHFKVVNDTYGHPSGDYVLKECAVILERSVRDSDVVARTGGEEFSIILPDAGRDRARQFAQRIRKTVGERAFIVFGHSIHVTTSIGAASYPENAEITEPQMLVYLADQALLRAKQLGRDRFVALDELDTHARQELRRQFRATRTRPRRTDFDSVLVADVRR